jgi:Periplasmic binding protein
MKHLRVVGLVTVVSAAVVLPVLPASAQKAGQSCKKLNEAKGNLVCTAKGSKRVWTAKPATTAAPTTVAAAPGATAAPAAAAGVKPVPGFDGKTIKIGVIANVATNPSFPSSALFADGGKALYAGFDSYIKGVNDKGGIGGKYKIEQKFKDAYYDAGETKKAYAEMKADSAMIGFIYGTPNTQALRDDLKSDNLIGTPISLDAEWVTNENIMPVGTTYQSHAINVVDWYIKEGGGAGKTLCALTIAPNPYGVAFEEGYEFASKKMGFKSGGKFRWSTADAVAQQLKDAKCDAVANAISGELHMSPLLLAGTKIGFEPLYLSSSPSFASRRVTPETSNQYGKQVVVVIDGAQWGDTSVPGMKAHMDAIQKYYPEYIGNVNPATMWGWAIAAADVALLEKAVALGDLSKEGMKKALAQVGDVSTGGVYPTFKYVAQGQRVAPTSNYVMKVDITTPGSLKLVKAWESPVAKEYKR